MSLPLIRPQAREGKKADSLFKMVHYTKTIKGSGPHALDCKHTAVFVTVWLRSNDITGEKSSAEKARSCAFSELLLCLCVD